MVEKQKWSTKKKVLVGFGILVVLAAVGNAGGKKAEADTAAPSGSAVAAQPSQPVAKPEAQAEPSFIAERKAFCKNYDDAPNDIKKSGIFSAYMSAVKGKGYSFEGVVAKVSKIETPHGGGHVLFTVDTSYGDVNNNALLQGNSNSYKIGQGSPLYEQIGNLANGQKIRVWATDVLPAHNPFSERVTICGDKWLAKFTKVEAL
jgi:hypothetical protein